MSWLAKKLNCNRPAVYRILNKMSIDTSLLMSISIILHRNFFEELQTDINERLHRNDTEVLQ